MQSQGLADEFHEYWDTSREELPRGIAERSAWLKEMVISGDWDRLVEQTWQHLRNNN